LAGCSRFAFAGLRWFIFRPPVGGAYIELAGGLCPLTTIEAGFHRMAGDAGYSGSFIEHYLLPIIYPAGLMRDIRLWLAGFVIRVNVAIYSRLIYRLRLSRAT
jgi:hypothetical protein